MAPEESYLPYLFRNSHNHLGLNGPLNLKCDGLKLASTTANVPHQPELCLADIFDQKKSTHVS